MLRYTVGLQQKPCNIVCMANIKTKYNFVETPRKGVQQEIFFYLLTVWHSIHSMLFDIVS